MLYQIKAHTHTQTKNPSEDREIILKTNQMSSFELEKYNA